MMKILYSYVFVLLVVCFSIKLNAQNILVPTDNSQNQFVKAYKCAIDYSTDDFKVLEKASDSLLYPTLGEYSVYWKRTGNNRGSFYIPDSMISTYKDVDYLAYDTMNWQSQDYYSLPIKRNKQSIAIFRSTIGGKGSVNWESIYFKTLFDSYLFYDMYRFVNEDSLKENALTEETRLLIIPAFSAKEEDQKFYVDSMFEQYGNLRPYFDKFLSKGGMIYTEGNAVYLMEKLGYLDSAAVDFSQRIDGNNLTVNDSENPISWCKDVGLSSVFTSASPFVNARNAQVIAKDGNDNPVIFMIQGSKVKNGKIVCNLGLPTVGGISQMLNDSRQIQWTLNTIFTAFVQTVDVTRTVFNEIPNDIAAGPNAIPYDHQDTFEVTVHIKNLSNKNINGIQINENIRSYFSFVGVKEKIAYTIQNNQLSFMLNIGAKSEINITYYLSTPEVGDSIHELIDDFLDFENNMYISKNETRYFNQYGINYFLKNKNYGDMMFSADIFADTDLNWKNFLGLEYQPFKVFTIMENKARTQAQNAQYIQYIPKDVPFYWSDPSIDIPILKTPGGQFVDVLKGSSNENNPEFDMDSDGKPDVWLDTASIYPKGYTIKDSAVYWLNPWAHLRGEAPYYEDIDHDGIYAQDTNGDGIVDIEEPGDKIRVWIVTWDMDEVPGYQIYDPYCSYEIWVDPPQLVKLAGGVGYANDSCKAIDNMFYPYTPGIDTANLNNDNWKHWMEKDKNGDVIWKQFIYQKINNYEGFTFIDTAATGYQLKPTDSCMGTVPQPHREFIAVLSLGGEEIDMYHPTPEKSHYSNLNYETIFDEKKTTPIRTTYTYYAPLPNPLQFEYLTNNLQLTTLTEGTPLKYLPNLGKVNLTFEMDASTEYTYYWIRNVGTDVKYNDPSLTLDSIDEYGDGVFGYLIYTIPKGTGGYKIHLPKRPDGSYDTDALVQVDGQPFSKWIDNHNTGDAIEVWEDVFNYKIYIPQLLIPPALDDDNNDGIDDWIDDRGDRFSSKTGFLNDHFMPGNGEKYKNHPSVPFKDDIYGMVDSGWYAGIDNTYGDDFFEKMGKTHVTINTIYEGKGKEGPVEISKGGILVVEEIFGGSPWVITSHVLSGFAKGVNYELTSQMMPQMVDFGEDTTLIKHTIKDLTEPHVFDHNFDPYMMSWGYGDATITSYAGGKDPCSLISPDYTMPTTIDPDYHHQNITLLPFAGGEAALSGYPKQLSGTFFEVRIEVNNADDYNWINSTITPDFSKIGNTETAMAYVAYPRPLVPGDNIADFEAGWRFNEPTGEVLVKMGETLPLLQPGRKAYFIFLIKVDEALANGIYEIPFTIEAEKQHYDGTSQGSLKYEVPPVMFSIVERTATGAIVDYPKMVIGQGNLTNIEIETKNNMKGLQNVKWATHDIYDTDFAALTQTLPTNYNGVTETINLSQFKNFPSIDTTELFILEQVETFSDSHEAEVNITDYQRLNYIYDTMEHSIDNQSLTVIPVGPFIRVKKEIYSINGVRFDPKDSAQFYQLDSLFIVIKVKAQNAGNDIAQATKITTGLGQFYEPIADSLPDKATIDSASRSIISELDVLIPGQSQTQFLHFKALFLEDSISTGDLMSILYDSEIRYDGTVYAKKHVDNDKDSIKYEFYDLYLKNVESNHAEISANGTVTLTIDAINRALPIKTGILRTYLIDNNDTVIIDEHTLTNVQTNEQIQYDIEFTAVDTIGKLEFYSRIDDNEEILEVKETNNTKMVRVSLLKDPIIRDIVVSPNPFEEEATFTYKVSKELDDIVISFYSMNGTLVRQINNCPKELGENTFTWKSTLLSSGTYSYKISGIYSYLEPLGTKVAKFEIHHGIIIKVGK